MSRERVVVASMLGAIKAIPDELFDIARPEHFEQPTLRRAFDVMRDLHVGGVAIDAASVALEYRKRHPQDFPDERAAAGYFMDLATSADVSAAGNLTHHARELRTEAINRDIERQVTTATATAKQTGDYLGLVTHLAGVAGNVDDALRPRLTTAATAERELQALFDEGDPVTDAVFGLSSHFGDINVIGAQTGLGKSAAALQLARGYLDSGLGVTFISTELSAPKALLRLAQQRVDGLGLGTFRSMWETRREEIVTAVSDERLVVETGCPNTLPAIVARLRQAARDGHRVVIIDHIHDAAHGTPDEVSLQIRQLAEAVRATGVICWAVSQLNKSSFADDALSMSHLRGTAAISDVAALVVMMQRMSESHPDRASYRVEPGGTVTRLLVAEVCKDRHGLNGYAEIHLALEGSRMRLSVLNAASLKQMGRPKTERLIPHTAA